MANLRSQHAKEISSETVKLMRLFGENVKKVFIPIDPFFVYFIYIVSF